MSTTAIGQSKADWNEAVLRRTGDVHAEPCDMTMSSAAAMYIHGRLRYGHQQVIEKLSYELEAPVIDHSNFNYLYFGKMLKGESKETVHTSGDARSCPHAQRAAWQGDHFTKASLYLRIFS